MSGIRTLVTGGAGFIGSHLVDRLVEAGHAVTVLDDFSTGSEANLQQAKTQGSVRIVEGSVEDIETVETALESCDRVFHLAVQCVRRSLGEPLRNHAVNATGTIIALEAARKKGITRFIYCSSSEVYGNTSDSLLSEDTTICAPATVYGAAKLAGELYANAYQETYGLPVTIVRPFNAFGPREHDKGDLAEVIPRFVIRVLNGEPPVIFGDGSNSRDFTYISDISRGLLMAGESGVMIGQTVNIAYGRAISIAAVAKAVTKACGRNDLGVVFAAKRPGDVHTLHADVTRARELLSYRCEVPFEEGIRRYVKWFRSVYSDPSMLREKGVENWVMPDRPRGA